MWMGFCYLFCLPFFSLWFIFNTHPFSMRRHFWVLWFKKYSSVYLMAKFKNKMMTFDNSQQKKFLSFCYDFVSMTNVKSNCVFPLLNFLHWFLILLRENPKHTSYFYGTSFLPSTDFSFPPSPPLITPVTLASCFLLQGAELLPAIVATSLL